MRNPLNSIPDDQKNGIIVLLVLALILAVHVAAGLWRVNQKLKDPTERYLRGVKVGLCWSMQTDPGHVTPGCEDCRKDLDRLNREAARKKRS